MKSNNKTGVLLFAESVQLQAEKKQLHKDANANYDLHRQFIAKSSNTVRKAGFDFFHFDETNQTSGSFGNRLASAASSLFAKGYDRIIIIGNDSPDLSPKVLIGADHRLKNESIVLGPDYRGGVYLIGLNRDSFFSGAFEKLHWQADDLRRSFTQYARRYSKSIAWLKPKADFNEEADLTTNYFLSSALRKLLFVVAGILPVYVRTSERILSSDFSWGYSRRGPPL